MQKIPDALVKHPGSWFALTIVLMSACSGNEVGSAETSAVDSVHYEIYFGDRLAGKQTSWHEDSTYHYLYGYNDRGRGPFYQEYLILNSDGLLVEQKIKGHNYQKDPVNEQFQVRNDTAFWESRIEQGHSLFEGKSYYLSINGSEAAREHLVRKLLNTSDSTLVLLPQGEVKLIGNRSYNFGDSLQLSLVTIQGLDFEPTNFWLDQNQEFFAGLIPGWRSCIRKGYGNILPDLLKLQEQADDEYLADLAAELVNRPSNIVVIQNVDLFDPGSGSLKPGRTVVMEGNVISRIDSSSQYEIPEDALVIDGAGKTLLPGLFDMHVHIQKIDGILHLASGVTAVRDMANALDINKLNQQYLEDRYLGPRIVSKSGFIDGAGEFAGPSNKLIKNDISLGYQFIDEYHQDGYKQIKLYSSIKPEWVAALASRAHNLGMKVSGHIPAFMTAEEAIRDGYDEIQHINMIFLNFLPDTIDTRTPKRFTMVAEHHQALDLEGEDFKNFVSLLKEKNVVIDPTVSVFERIFEARAGEPDPMYEDVIDRFPPQVQRRMYTGSFPVPEGMEEQYATAHDKMLEVINILHQEGVILVPGTDALPGFTLHKELENYVKAGITPQDVLTMATLTSAEVCGVDDQLGSIQPGKLADLILVQGNPLEDISKVRNVQLTIKNGNLYYPEDLYQAVGVSPQD